VLGLELSDLEAVPVYEENYPVFDLFCYMATQWNVGMAGATGLKYEVAHHKLDRSGLDAEEYEYRMEGLRIMEQTALQVMRDNSKEK
jgi:hypothetical protein